MNKSNVSWLIAAFIIVSVCITAWQYIQKRQTTKEKFSKYVAAQATVIDRMPERVTRYGVKQSRYTVSFKDANGKQYTLSDCELGTNHKPNDTLTIYYNPQNPADEITTYIGK